MYSHYHNNYIMSIPIEKIPFSLINPSTARISQGFGENKVPFYKQLGMKGHNGIDYACGLGSNIVCPVKMEIVSYYYENVDAGYGTTLWGRTDEFTYEGEKYKLEMVFGHLSEFHEDVQIGVKFNRGDLIAYSGNTGKYTTGPHLHWGVRVVKKTSSGGWAVLEPNNGYKGYFDQEPLINKEDNMRFIKTEDKPAVYLVVGDKRLMIIDMPTLMALSGQIEVVTNQEMSKYADNGTLSWYDRVIN